VWRALRRFGGGLISDRRDAACGFEIQPDLSLGYAWGPLASRDPEITNLQAAAEINGTFTTDA
jgi:hypothetical protein